MATITTKDGTVMQIVSALVPPEDVKRAKELGINRSEVFRKALRKAIKVREGDTS